MKGLLRKMIVGAVLLTSISASAQYYEIANQIPQLITPALTGGFRYKGFVEADYLKGVGSYNADFLGFSTSQGFKYADWFYMGVGIGVDVMFASPANHNDIYGPNGGYVNHSSVTTAAMIPLFTDFRFKFGSNAQSISFFADLKIGCSFLCSDSWVSVGDGYLTSEEYFLLKPSIGVRIPVNKNNSKQAVDVGLTYQLLTSNYWMSYNSSVTLNSLGVTVSYEW